MLADILKTLYSPNGDIYPILNQSRHIEEIRKKTEIYLLFNTGFSFRTHKGTYMELYYDFSRQEVIRSTKSPLPIKPPQLLGFIGAILHSKYLDRACDYLCIQINPDEITITDPDELPKGLGFVDYQNMDEVIEKGSLLPAIEILDANGAQHTHSAFQIIGADECVNLPLRHTFKQPVFYDGKTFSAYEPSTYSRILSKEEWLDEEFGEEAGTAYWNID